MPTPDNSRTRQLTISCSTIGCPNTAMLTSKYCAKCNAEIRSSLTDKARHSKLRISRKPDIMMATGRIRSFIDVLLLPCSSTALRYAICAELLRLDGLLQDHGPANAELRLEIRTVAAIIRQHLLLKKGKDAEDARQFVHATELLVDVGMEAPVDAMALRKYASDAVAFYLASDDRPRLARAVLVYANTWRLPGQENRARWYMRHALNILEEWCDRSDPSVAVLLHNALLHNLRFFVEDWSGTMRERARARLERLADRIGTPAVWLETYRELVHFWIVAGNRTRAMDAYDSLQKLRNEHRFPEYGLFSLRRPEVHVLLECGSCADRKKALEMIQGDFVGMYLSDRHCYYYDALRGWEKKYPELSLDLNEEGYAPQYGAVILTYLPRDKAAAA